MATPTYSELASMAASSSFIDRVTMAVVIYARYLLAEAANVADHRRRANWAQTAIQNPRGIVTGLLPAIAADGQFANQDPLDLASTTDSALQIAIEATINSTLLTF